MKRHCKLIISTITMALILCILPFHTVAYADPFTASQIAATSYALMNSWGIDFASINASTIGMSEFMSDEVNQYVADSSSTIAEKFVGTIAVDAAGKLVVGQTIYNSVIDFKDWLVDKYNLISGSSSLTAGRLGDKFVPTASLDASVDISSTGVSVLFDTPYQQGLRHVQVYYNAGLRYNNYVDGYYFGTWSIGTDANNNVGCYLPGHSQYGYDFNAFIALGFTTNDLDNKLNWDGTDYVAPTVINPSQEWAGDIDGYSAPDTNLDQLLNDVFEAIANNDLVVDGEVIDVPIPPEPTPVPPPTPAPIDPQTPLSEVPWEGLDNNIHDLYEQGAEENGLIGDLNDSVNTGFSSVFGWLQDIIDWLQNIWEKIENVGLDIIDAIEHFLESFESIGMDIVEWLEGIFEAIGDIAESIVNADANWFSDIVDAILTPFRPWINTLKSATGLWHYIVEWLQCIATPFGFFWSVLSGIGVCFVRPIYAVAAFAIVIAIYKRFGK